MDMDNNDSVCDKSSNFSVYHVDKKNHVQCKDCSKAQIISTAIVRGFALQNSTLKSLNYPNI